MLNNTDLVNNETLPEGSGQAATEDSTGRPEDNGADRGAQGGAPERPRANLSSMVIADLRQLADSLNITGTAGMRKSDLIAAIKQRQGGTVADAPGDAQLALPTADSPQTEIPDTAAAAASRRAAHVGGPEQRRRRSQRTSEQRGGRCGHRGRA